MSRAAPRALATFDERAAAYAELGRFSTVAIGGAFGVAVRRSIVRQYVRAYLVEHGRFPVGPHVARGSWQGKRISFETRFPGKAGAALAAFGHRLTRDEALGLPPVAREGAFARAKRQYLESQDRDRLRAWLLQQAEEALRYLPPENPARTSS